MTVSAIAEIKEGQNDDERNRRKQAEQPQRPSHPPSSQEMRPTDGAHACSDTADLDQHQCFRQAFKTGSEERHLSQARGFGGRARFFGIRSSSKPELRRAYPSYEDRYRVQKDRAPVVFEKEFLIAIEAADARRVARINPHPTQ